MKKSMFMFQRIQKISLAKFLESAYELSADQAFVDEKKCFELIGVDVKLLSLIQLTIKSKIEIIPCDHTLPCVGYGLIEVEKEYIGLSGKELAELKNKA